MSTEAETAAETSSPAGYSSVRPTTSPRTFGRARALPHEARRVSGSSSTGSPPRIRVGMVVASMTRSMSATAGSFSQV